MKFQLLVDQSTGLIRQLVLASQHQHDITLAREQTDLLPMGSVCLADSGYQGLTLEGVSVVYPFKKPRKRELDTDQKAFNRRLAQLRVTVEHRIRSLKIFRLLKGVYRGRRRRLELRL